MIPYLSSGVLKRSHPVFGPSAVREQRCLFLVHQGNPYRVVLVESAEGVFRHALIFVPEVCHQQVPVYTGCVKYL